MTAERVNELLHTYSPILLEEMDRVKLMDRTDTKFVFRAERLAEVLEKVQPHYRVLEVDGHRASRYETLYYDTDDFRLYQQHHFGKLNRYKVRVRRYVESDERFFEVKFKNNRGRTIKKRIRNREEGHELPEKAIKFLIENTPLLPESLRPKIWVFYRRVTLVSNDMTERVTIDLDLRYRAEERELDLSGIVIAEVKREKASALSSPLIRALKEMRIKEGSVSKYCLGVAGLFEHVRKNNFKEKIRHLNKIHHAA